MAQTQGLLTTPQTALVEDKTRAIPLKPRLRQVVHLLPKHRWQVKPAAMEAGYRESYAQRLATLLKENVNFCQAVEARRAQIREQLWSEDAWRDECEDALHRARDARDRGAEVQILKMMGQNIGALSKDKAEGANQMPVINLHFPPGLKEDQGEQDEDRPKLPEGDGGRGLSVHARLES